jgi:hypothetical protein
MLACVSPASVNFEPTLSTLRYAARARAIQNRVKQNSKYTLEDEVAYLREQVRGHCISLQQEVQLMSSRSGGSQLSHTLRPCVRAASNPRATPGDREVCMHVLRAACAVRERAQLVK